MDTTKKISTRQAYGEALVELGAINPKVVVLDADLAAATKTGLFRKAYPDRHFNCGIAEGNMTAVAAGLAASGLIPYISTFAMFAAGRAYDQVRNAVAYPHLNVKICATHAGITVGEDGATHQCIEDIALMRVIPGMTVISPADGVEARAAVLAIADIDAPVYMRLGRSDLPIINGADYKFELGKAVTLRAPKNADLTIIATGIMVSAAIDAAVTLEAEGIHARVLNIHTIKPIDRDAIIAAARETGAIITAEEHNIIGGLGSAVTEVVCESRPVPVKRVGVKDIFGRSGKVAPLLELYGLTAGEIARTARTLKIGAI